MVNSPVLLELVVLVSPSTTPSPSADAEVAAAAVATPDAGRPEAAVPAGVAADQMRRSSQIMQM